MDERFDASAFYKIFMFSQACAENVQLKVRKAPYQVQVIKRPGGSFFRTLRQKLMWGSDSRAHEC